MNFKQWQWFNVFIVISQAWQGYESKAYGVLNHNLKLQCKKFSRTRDIPNFPTQGWADTAFCTRKRGETYGYSEVLTLSYIWYPEVLSLPYAWLFRCFLFFIYYPWGITTSREQHSNTRWEKCLNELDQNGSKIVIIGNYAGKRGEDIHWWLDHTVPIPTLLKW